MVSQRQRFLVECGARLANTAYALANCLEMSYDSAEIEEAEEAYRDAVHLFGEAVAVAFDGQKDENPDSLELKLLTEELLETKSHWRPE